jgi:hypothetical protein
MAGYILTACARHAGMRLANSGFLNADVIDGEFFARLDMRA